MIFGPYPRTDYVWSRPCSNDSVIFINKTQNEVGYPYKVKWDMNTIDPAGYYATAAVNPDSLLNTYYKFSKTGVFDISLTATTDIYNCIKTITTNNSTITYNRLHYSIICYNIR